MRKSNHMSISHILADIRIWKFSPYLLSLGQSFAPPPSPRGPPLALDDFSPERVTSSLAPTEVTHHPHPLLRWKMKFIGLILNICWAMLTDT